MPGLKDIPGPSNHRLLIPVMAGATTDDEFPLFVADSNLLVTGVRWVPNAAVTANGTNYTTLNIYDRGATDAGTALIASRSYAATNSAAQTPETLTLSATAANLLIASGDVITVNRVHTASGLIVAAGLVEVQVQYR